MDSEFLKWFATLGVGGLLAAFMFTFYRKDIKQYTELWKVQSERSEALTLRVIGVVADNTASNQKLISLIEVQERNSLRKGDIEDMIERQFNRGHS